MAFDKESIAAKENHNKANTAVNIILTGGMFTTIKYGKTEQKQPSEAIQRCFAGVQGKGVALLVIARAKANNEEGDQLREALERSGVSISDWEDFMNNSDA